MFFDDWSADVVKYVIQMRFVNLGTSISHGWNQEFL